MRSGLIFAVSSRFSNRYLLCRMLSASARKMHRDGVSTSQSINNSLRALHDPEPHQAGKPPRKAASAVQDVLPKVLDEQETAAGVR
jgi:hypothetical protein